MCMCVRACVCVCVYACVFVCVIIKCFSSLSFLQGIGDSAQGFANSLIFLLFTPDVRVTALKWGRHVCCPERVIRLPRDRIAWESTSLTYEESHSVNYKSILVKN